MFILCWEKLFVCFLVVYIYYIEWIRNFGSVEFDK